eukprot:6214149-Pleurochrysis_carterae.AAC.7
MASTIEHWTAPSREVACQQISAAAPSICADARAVDTGSATAAARTSSSSLHRHRALMASP